MLADVRVLQQQIELGLHLRRRMLPFGVVVDGVQHARFRLGRAGQHAADLLDAVLAARYAIERALPLHDLVPVALEAVAAELGRASSRDSVGTYVEISVAAVSLRK